MGRHESAKRPEGTPPARKSAVQAEPQVNVNSYNYNMSRRSDEEVQREMREYGGKLVARSADGRVAHVYGETYDEIFALLKSKKIPQEDAVIGRVDEEGVDEMF